MRDGRAHVEASGGRPQVVSSQLSVTAAAAEYGLSRGHLRRLLRRYRDGGLDALEPRSRRPHSSRSRATL
jgi:transposase